MKKTLSLLLCLSLTVVMFGCDKQKKETGITANQPAGVSDVLQQNMEAQDSSKTEQTVNSDTKPKSENNKKTNGKREDYYPVIDIDLTVLSSTMVFSEVYEIMVNPEAYFGKVMKMKGFCARYYDNVTGNDYFACMIPDATACCQTGIEFVLTDDYVFPDDYPEKDAEICIIGVFDVFQEGDYLFCALRDARLVY